MDSVGARDLIHIMAQWLACMFLYRRFAGTLTAASARLEAGVVRNTSPQWTCTTYSLPVSRRTHEGS